MAGSPVKRQRNAAIERVLIKKAQDAGCDDVLEFIEEYTSSGGTLVDLARNISIVAQIDVSRNALTKYLHNLAPDAEQRIAAARRTGADALVEEIVDISDSATEDDVQVQRLRVDTRKFVAGVFNPAMNPQRGGVNVQINLGQMHLDALRQANASARIVADGGDGADAPARARTLDAEVEVVGALEAGEQGSSVIETVITPEAETAN